MIVLVALICASPALILFAAYWVVMYRVRRMRELAAVDREGQAT